MCGGLKKRYILTALVCFGAVMSGGGFAQAESTTAESRSETRTTVDRNGTIADACPADRIAHNGFQRNKGQ